MDFLKDLFKDEALTFEQFSEAAKKAGVKIADLASGDYVSKKKYNDDLSAKDTQIETLNTTIASRDNDLGKLKNQLADAGSDKTKLESLSKDLSDLQAKYEADTKNYKTQLAKQAYEFAVKDFANTKKFSSNAAKRDFTSSMIAKELKFENGKILGADDFVAAYTVDNADAFITDNTNEQTAANTTKTAPPPPAFAQSTDGSKSTMKDENGFNFHFMGVRKKTE